MCRFCDSGELITDRGHHRDWDFSGSGDFSHFNQHVASVASSRFLRRHVGAFGHTTAGITSAWFLGEFRQPERNLPRALIFRHHGRDRHLPARQYCFFLRLKSGAGRLEPCVAAI